jgi:arsenite methyltransferase
MTSVISQDDNRHYKARQEKEILKSINWRHTLATSLAITKPNYGIDAPAVMRNLFVIGVACALFAIFGPAGIHVGPVNLKLTPMFAWTGGFLLAEACLFVLYVKVGKFRHRDFMLGLHTWRGGENVLDVGCGRGLLLAGAAKRIAAVSGSGHATGIDVWSNVDMGGNSAAATQHNLDLEGISSLCTLISQPAQEMAFPDASFDVIVSNLCLHNIYNAPVRCQALHQIVRVLKPGGIALISDYKRTGEYADEFRNAGLTVEKKRGSLLTTFPPLTVVIARKKR